MLLMMPSAVAAVALFALGRLGVAAEPPPPAPIYGGTSVPAGEHEAVVAIHTGGALCTGTAVTPHLVLTAGHCLDGVTDPSRVDIMFGTDATNPADETSATSIGVHPDFCPDEDCPEYEIFDYGYAMLAGTVSVDGGFPLPITDQDEWDQLMLPGQTVTLVGFGEADVDDEGNPYEEGAEESLGIKRKVDVGIVSFTESGFEFFAGGDGKDSCIGDSGGPALVTLEDDTIRLAGILSRGYDPCGKGGYYGVPFPALAWLEEETGENLLPESCNDGSCVDTTVPQREQGCACTATPTAPGVLSIVLGIALSRRRRGRAAGARREPLRPAIRR
jgi:MYXO-CTERM domain-containing protein